LQSTTVSIFIYLWRCLKLISHIVIGLFCAAFALPLLGEDKAHRLIRWWCHRSLTILNVAIKASGEIPDSKQDGMGRMFIANHISWVDILAIMSVTPVRFIAKSEIRRWPVFGYLAHRAKVIFIDRSKRQEAKRMQGISVNCLINGEQLCFFPEGTTTDGTHLLPFKGSIIQAAIDAKAILQPIGIYYPNPDGSANTDMAFAGETTLAESMHSILSRRSSLITLHFFAPTHLQGNHFERRALTQAAHNAIAQKLFW